MDGGGTGYLRTVSEYVHLNPARAKLLKPAQPLREHPRSSFGEYLKAAGQRVGWLRVDRVLGEMGIPKDSHAGREWFERMMEERRSLDDPESFRQIRRGWCFGRSCPGGIAAVDNGEKANHSGEGVEKRRKSESAGL